jgi:hypothetical protein
MPCAVENTYDKTRACTTAKCSPHGHGDMFLFGGLERGKLHLRCEENRNID